MADSPPQILLQTTIPLLVDDWHVGRFSLLRKHLAGLQNADGSPRYEVLARNLEREDDGNDPVLRDLGASDVAELWLIAVDTGDGLSPAEAAGIAAFRRRGGGVLTARDHQDLGSCLMCLGSIGRVNYFHSLHRELDETRHTRDDTFATTIDFPNYHSGSNGDYQTILPQEPVHELLRSSRAPGGIITQFPAHPHEGAVGTDGLGQARVIACGTSSISGLNFNTAVALENDVDQNGSKLGRAVAESTFHHFVDYNWDIASGMPSFVTDPPGDGIAKDPATLEIYKDYVTNLAAWLCGPPKRHWWTLPV
jgi:hypothetical protein